MRVVLEHVDERLTFVLVGILHELLSNDQTVLYWLEVRGQNLLAVVAQASADDGHERSVLDVVHEILFLNAKTLVTKRSEYERRRNLVEVRVVVRGRPSLKREETEREGDVVPDSWTKNWGPSVWDINGREQLKLES